MSESNVDPIISAAAAAMGRKGGQRRSENLSPERLKEIASKAGKASGRSRRKKAKARRSAA